MPKELFGTVQAERGGLLSNKVAEQINQLIIDRDLKAGDRLPNEFELCEELNVGRGTIREAIKILVARNCLQIRRGVGTFVAERTGQVDDPLGFNYEENKVLLAKDLLEIRLQLEPWIAETAAKRIREEEKSELVHRCDVLEETIRSGKDHVDEDKAFHTYIAECTHNSVIPKLIPIITYGVYMFTRLRDQELLDSTIQTHREIADAICRNDADAARDSMYRHLAANTSALSQLENM